MYGEKDDTGFRIREKRGHRAIGVIFQKATVPEFLLGHITKLGHLPASCVAQRDESFSVVSHFCSPLQHTAPHSRRRKRPLVRKFGLRR